MAKIEDKVVELRKIDAKPGDIIWIRLGLSADQMGDGPHNVAYIPSVEELERERAEWTNVIPPGVYLHVTHIGVDVTLVKGDERNAK